MADGAQAFSHDGAPERFQDSGKIQGKIPVCLEPPKNHQLNQENDGLVVTPIFNSWYICSSAEMFPNLLRVFRGLVCHNFAENLSVSTGFAREARVPCKKKAPLNGNALILCKECAGDGPNHGQDLTL